MVAGEEHEKAANAWTSTWHRWPRDGKARTMMRVLGPNPHGRKRILPYRGLAALGRYGTPPARGFRSFVGMSTTRGTNFCPTPPLPPRPPPTGRGPACGCLRSTRRRLRRSKARGRVRLQDHGHGGGRPPPRGNQATQAPLSASGTLSAAPQDEPATYENHDPRGRAAAAGPRRPR